MKLKIIMLFIFIISYSVFYYQNSKIKSERFDLELKNQINILKTHYDVTKNYFLTDVSSIQDNLLHNKKVSSIFEQAYSSNKEQRDILRDKLQKTLTPLYRRIKKRGVLQFHFVFPNNITFLRMHKPDKYGDDLSRIRYSFAYVNKYKKPIEGFEEGKTTHGFRYVFPYFSSNNKYLGAVDISLSSYSVQNKLLHINKIHSHFLVHKNIFSTNAWKAKNLVHKYINSIEHKDYMVALSVHTDKKRLEYNYKNLILPNKDKIDKNIALKIPFAVYKNINNTMKVITFLPISNIQGKKAVAYIVGYVDDNNLYQIYKSYKNLNIIIFFGLLLLIYFIYKNIYHKTSLEIEVKNKTKLLKKREIQLEKANKNLEKKVKEKTLKLENNMNIMSQYVIYSKTDLDGFITEVSDAFCRTTKYKADELIGRKHNILKHPNVKKSVYKDMWSTIKNNKSWHGEIQNIDKYGKSYWISTTISPEYDINGNKIGYIAIRYDITATKEFEQQQQRLKQAEKLASMGEMIGNIAHQWRQPLSVISTASTGIKLQKEMGVLDDDSLLKNCDAINENAQYLSKTIDDFKNFIKGDRVRSIFSLEDEINSFLSLVDGTIKNNNINIILDLEKDLKIDGYQNELTQCLINIFNNAKDALKENIQDQRYIFITTKKDKNQIIIKIRDNAKGIPQNIIQKIFDPYFTTKHQSQGTGLGLHMTYNLIVDGMNGTIEVRNVGFKYKSNYFTGAEFIIKLPIS
jgi:PAS domain S-box-containing protein